MPAPTDLLISGGVIGTAPAFYAQFAEPENIALMYVLFRRATLNRAFEEKEDMARFILDIHERRGMTILLVEHDMGLVMDIAHRMVVLDFGVKIAEGTPNEIKANPAVIKAYLGVAERKKPESQIVA